MLRLGVAGLEHQFGDVEVGFVGAVTEHLPELVSPAGIADIEVTDIADAVNTEADELKAQGVDIVVMLVHEGAPTSSCDSVTDPTNDFGAIVTRLDGNVDAVITSWTLVHAKGGILLPQDHGPIRQAGAVVAGAPQHALARKFLSFLQSESGRAILARHGLTPP